MTDDDKQTGRMPTITSVDDGRVEIVGDLTFDTVALLWSRGAEVLDGGKTVTLDLDAVTRADSAGLALMVEWLKHARRHGARITVVNMPAQMLAIARMSKLDKVLLSG